MAFKPQNSSNATGGNQPRAQPQAPTKNASQGSYNFVQYCPVWTDPDWQDEGPERAKSTFNIQDKVFDRLRPALLPRDQFKQPSIYAQRFSIFPGRTDGRSRASPTRTESRHLFPANAEVKTGKQLFDRFDELAQQSGEHIDDYMERTRPDLQKLDETEQQYMQQYEDLLVDENWQTILFGSLTMDEVSRASAFSSLWRWLTNTRYKLRGILPCQTTQTVSFQAQYISKIILDLFRLSLTLAASLLSRDLWIDTRAFGHTADRPRYMYTLDGQREEWDPRVCETETRVILLLTFQV
jgi:hypothetical protein